MITESEFVDSFKSPRPSRYTESWWEGLRRHTLVMQRCQDCGQISHPPGPVCKNCMSERMEWEELSGLGEVYTHTTIHRAMHPEFEADLPFITAYVKLDEGPMLVTWLREVDLDADLIGLRVRATFEQIDDRITLHRFVPAEESA